MSQCFPWFPKIKPIATPDPIIMACRDLDAFDKMLALLTARDNDAQIKMAKAIHLPGIAQHPAIKAQVCPIIIGGQGIGKSLFGGDILMRALFGSMAGMADAGALHRTTSLSSHRLSAN